MYYLTMEAGNIKLNAAEKLPAYVEELYQEIRQKYTIDYYLSDWADDDGDSGMGYCYDNSYGMKREPARKEMVIRDGSLAGFYVGRIPACKTEEDYYLSADDTAKYFLKLSDDEGIIDDRQIHSNRYSDYERWDIIEEEAEAFCGFVFLLYVKQAEKNHIFTPADFSEELVEEVVKQIYIEDSRGHFDDAFRVKLRLKPEAAKQPDKVLEAFSEYRAFLVRE